MNAKTSRRKFLASSTGFAAAGFAAIAAWPAIPRDRPWKEGICDFFGEPVPGVLWKRLLTQVSSYVDLEPALVGAVESLIDFVTAPI